MTSSSSDDDAYPPEWWGAQARVAAPRGATAGPVNDSMTAVAEYLADMTRQLESMAVAANLELIAYLLAMARSEADSIARTGLGGGAKRG